MAKAARITGNIQGHAGQDLTYTIYSDHGSVLTSPEEVKATLADGVKFTYDSGDAEEVFAPFVSSTAELRFLVDHDDEIDALVEMARGTESDTYIIFERANGNRWCGNLLPEDVEVEITDGHTEISMTFTDGLSLLKGMDFKVDANDIFIRPDEVAGSPYQPGRTGLGLAWVLLNKIPWMQEVSWPAGTVAIREAAGIGTDTTGLYRPNLPYVGFNPSAFSKEKENPRRGRTMPKPKSFVNCYDVLGDILETLGMRIAWDWEGWAMRSPLIADDFATGVLEYAYQHSDLVANGRGAIDGSLAFTPWAYDLDVSYAMEEGATRRFTQKFSGARAVHTEAGSNQLFSKFDDVLYPDADRLENKDQLRDSDPLVEFESESDITLRTQGYFDLKGGIKAKNASGHKPCAVIKLKLGTTSHSSDPYLLSSDMLVQGYDTTIDGPAAASSMRCWANATLPDAEWILESAKGADAYNNPGLLYIPLTWSGDSFNPNAPSVDHGSDGTFYGGLHTALKSGETNVLKYDKWGQLHFDVTLPTIVTPGVDLEGYEIEFGLAFFGAGEFPVSSNKSPEILNTVTGATTGAGTAEEELFDEYIEKFVFHKGRLFKGDGTGEADRIYFEETSNGAPDSFEFAEVRVASGKQEGVAAVGPKFINRNGNLWSAGTEAWSYDIDWISYSGNVTSNSSKKENLELLADEWLLNNSGGVEVLSANFAPNYLAASAMPTGADLFSTACATPGATFSYYLPTRFTWSSISGMDFEGVEMLRDTTVGTFAGFKSEKEEPNMAKPFVKSIDDGLAGKNKSTADTRDEVITARGGNTDVNNRFLELESFDAFTEDGLLLLSEALDDPNLNISGGEYNGIQFDQSGASNGQALIYNSTSGKWEAGSAQGQLGDLTDVDATSTAYGSMVMRNIDNDGWQSVSPATVAAQVDSHIDLEDLGNVTGTPSTGEVLKWTGSTWEPQPDTGSGGGATTLNGLNDVSITQSNVLDFLMFNGTNWADASALSTAGIISGLMTLDDVSDVDATGVANGDVIKYNSVTSKWEAGAATVATPTLDAVTTAGATTTNNVSVGDLEAAAVTAETLSTGDPISGYLNYPTTDGSTGQVLTTDGAGNLSFTTVSGSSSTPTLSDVTAQGATTSDRVTLNGGYEVNPDGLYSTLSTAFVGNDSTSFTQMWLDNAGNIDAYLSNGGNMVVTGSMSANSVQVTNGVSAQYTLPNTPGTSGQVLAFPSSGNVLEWVTPSTGGSSNPVYRFEQFRYNSVTTATDTYFWYPGSTTYGFNFYDGSEQSSHLTSGYWSRMKKMSHYVPAGTYDIDVRLDLAVSTNTSGTGNPSEYNGQTVGVYLYKLEKTNSSVTFTQIGTTQNLTLDATAANRGGEVSFTESGVSMDGTDRLFICLKSAQHASGNRYAHWTYNIDATKTN